jgi:hypothetical protein
VRILTGERIKGFVIAGDVHPVTEKVTWKVRVNQVGHSDYKKKFEVASTHASVELAKGVDVTFIIGSFGPQPDNKQKRKAVDVMVTSTK